MQETGSLRLTYPLNYPEDHHLRDSGSGLYRTSFNKVVTGQRISISAMGSGSFYLSLQMGSTSELLRGMYYLTCINTDFDEPWCTDDLRLYFIFFLLSESTSN